MSEIITINGVEYSPVKKGAGQRIVVIAHGHVIVGNCEDLPDGRVSITNAKTIRRWGTTKGLGELSRGPLADTKHDHLGEVIAVPLFQILNVSGW